MELNPVLVWPESVVAAEADVDVAVDDGGNDIDQQSEANNPSDIGPIHCYGYASDQPENQDQYGGENEDDYQKQA